MWRVALDALWHDEPRAGLCHALAAHAIDKLLLIANAAFLGLGQLNTPQAALDLSTAFTPIGLPGLCRASGGRAHGPSAALPSERRRSGRRRSTSLRGYLKPCRSWTTTPAAGLPSAL